MIRPTFERSGDITPADPTRGYLYADAVLRPEAFDRRRLFRVIGVESELAVGFEDKCTHNQEGVDVVSERA